MPIGVTYGLVTGISEAITPAGFAYLTIPLAGSSSMTPMLFWRSASRRMPRTLPRRLGSGMPMPLSWTLIGARRVAVTRSRRPRQSPDRVDRPSAGRMPRSSSSRPCRARPACPPAGILRSDDACHVPFEVRGVRVGIISVSPGTERCYGTGTVTAVPPARCYCAPRQESTNL